MWKKKFFKQILIAGEVIGGTLGYWIGAFLGKDILFRGLGCAIGFVYGALVTHVLLTKDFPPAQDQPSTEEETNDGNPANG